jgi:predicted nuclease of predicted toxin-antitoxin system
MNQLFIDLYLDEDVDILIADLLNAYGFDALTARDAGNLGLTDSSQLAFAIDQNRTMLTHNQVDFELLAQKYFDSGQSHQGIICAFRQTPAKVVHRLLIILEHTTADEIKNQIRYI